MKKEHTLSKVFEKQGIKELYGEDIPVMFKCTLVTECSTIEAGTLGIIKLNETYRTPSENGNKTFKIEARFPIPHYEEYSQYPCRFRCEANLFDNTLVLINKGKRIPLTDVFCSPDKEISEMMIKNDKAVEEYNEAIYEQINTDDSAKTFGVAVVSLFVVISVIIAACYFTAVDYILSDFIKILCGLFAVCVISAIVYYIVYFFKRRKLTKKIEITKKISEDLYETIIEKDAEFVKKFTFYKEETKKERVKKRKPDYERS